VFIRFFSTNPSHGDPMSMQRKRVQRPVRRARHSSAWIVRPGRADQECQVVDVSVSGAKLIADMPSLVPSRFELAFTLGGSQPRLCEVLWRRSKMIGIRFV
jgi:hypothetical protein